MKRLLAFLAILPFGFLPKMIPDVRAQDVESPFNKGLDIPEVLKNYRTEPASIQIARSAAVPVTETETVGSFIFRNGKLIGSSVDVVTGDNPVVMSEAISRRQRRFFRPNPSHYRARTPIWKKRRQRAGISRWESSGFTAMKEESPAV